MLVLVLVLRRRWARVGRAALGLRERLFDWTRGGGGLFLRGGGVLRGDGLGIVLYSSQQPPQHPSPPPHTVVSLSLVSSRAGFGFV